MKAFPTEHPLSGYMDLMSDGMDLRDYFAIKIVQAMISNKKIYEMHPDEKSIVKDAYIVADYMIEARKK